MNILILEDEFIASERIKKLISEILPDSRITYCDSIESCMELLIGGYEPHLAFFDIQLGDGLSFEILENIPCKFPIVFTTAFDDYAIKAFKFNSVDYLLKPLVKEELENSIQKYKTIFEKSIHSEDFSSIQISKILEMLPIKRSFKQRFLIKSGDKYTSILVQDIAYFAMEEKVVFAYMKENSTRYLIDYQLDEIEKTLNPELFFRLNRQYISSIDAIKKFSNQLNGKLKIELLPTSKEEVIMSREKASQFKFWMDV